MITYLTIDSKESYENSVVEMIASFEGHIGGATDIGDGKATIGYGYTFNRTNNLDLWTSAGISLTEGQISVLRAIDSAPASQRTMLAVSLFSRSISNTEARALLKVTYPEYEARAVELGMPYSWERVALISYCYNRGANNPRMAPLLSAIRDGNREEAWYQMRYQSQTQAAIYVNGIANRRYSESDCFGLFDIDVSSDDAKKALQMYTRHRDDPIKAGGIVYAGIAAYESRFLPPQSIKDELTPATDMYLQEYVQGLGLGVSIDGEILVGDDSGNGGSVGADYRLSGSELGDLILGEGGADTIVGGAGGDVLYGGLGFDVLQGGSGDDTYVYRQNDGADTITDSSGADAIFVDGVALYGGDYKGSATAATWVDEDHRLTYTFIPDASTPDIGRLEITGDGLGGNSNNRITITNFSLSTAEDRWGLSLPLDPKVGVVEGVLTSNPYFSNTDYVPPTDPSALSEGGSGQYTLVLNNVANVDRTLTLSAAGATGLFLVTGDDTTPFNGGTLPVIVPAGQNSVTFGLVQKEDIDSVQNVQFTATLPGENGTSQVTGSLTLNINGAQEAAFGGSYALNSSNVIVGDNEANLIEGGSVTDTHYNAIYGSGGSDTMFARMQEDEQAFIARGETEVEAVATGGIGGVGATGWQMFGNDFNANATGGAGENDKMFGSAYDDSMRGGVGADLLAGGGGDDFLQGDGPVNNLTNMSSNNDGDVIYGGNGNDSILGGRGDDVIYAGNGIDTLWGGVGSDALFGGDGNDTLLSDSQESFFDQFSMTTYFTLLGDDFLDGGNGNDILVGGSGDDAVFGGMGNDTLRGGTREGTRFNTETGTNFTMASAQYDALFPHDNDYLDGEGGTDQLDGGVGDDVLLGGEDNDLLFGDYATSAPEFQGDDALFGEAGDDQLIGYGGADQLDGGAGIDILIGGKGQDDLAGGTENDHLEGGEDEDRLSGGAGNDTLLGDHDSTMVDAGTPADLKAGVADYLDGGAGNDVVNGQGGDDEIVGGDGLDTLYGDKGNDQISGGAGADRIYGDNTVSALSSADHGNDYIDAGSEDDSVYAGAGDDIALGGDGNDTVAGEEGSDSVFGGAGNDTLHGDIGGSALSDQGNDFVSGDAGADYLVGYAGNDTLDGGSENDQLFGMEGDDELAGGDGNDQLIAGIGNDVVNGGSGDDQIQGGTGDDLLAGGEGGDIYYIAANDGVDSISDDGGTDFLALSGVTASDLTFGLGSLKIGFTNGATSQIHIEDFDPLNATESSIEYVTFANGTGGYSGTQSLSALIAQKGFDIAGDGYVAGTNIQDRITTGADADFVQAEAGSDVVNAGAGDDVVYGGDGTDTLNGGDDADWLIGGAGNDSLNGGLGDDTYVIASGDGDDVIIESGGYDQVMLSDTTAAQMSYVLSGSDLVLTLLSDDGITQQVTLQNWTDPAASVDAIMTADGVTFTYAQINASLSNRPPDAVNDSAAVQEDVVLTVSGNVLNNDSDPDGTPLLVQNPGTLSGSWGVLVLAANGDYTYALDNIHAQTLKAGSVVTENFTYTAVDGLPNGTTQAVLSVTVRGTNDAPVITADTASTTEDAAVSGNVLGNDSDIDAGTVLSVRNPGTYQGTFGALLLNTNGGWTYTPNAAAQSLALGENVSETFTVTVGDGVVDVASSLQLSIVGRNDAPTVDVPLLDQSVNGGAILTYTVPTDTFVDVDQGDVFVLTAAQANGSALPSWLSFDANTATFTGTAPTSSQSLTVSVAATDTQGAIGTDSFVLTVVGASGGGGNGGGNGGSQGNEGVGNGEDAPPPGHDTNQNDGPGTGPGNPGNAHHGNPIANQALVEALDRWAISFALTTFHLDFYGSDTDGIADQSPVFQGLGNLFASTDDHPGRQVGSNRPAR